MDVLTLAFAAIGWISVVTGHACLTVGTSGEVTALFAHATVHTCAVAITLASCRTNRDKLWILTFGKYSECNIFHNLLLGLRHYTRHIHQMSISNINICTNSMLMLKKNDKLLKYWQERQEQLFCGRLTMQNLQPCKIKYTYF